GQCGRARIVAAMGSELQGGVRRAVTSDRLACCDGLPAPHSVRVGDPLFGSGQASSGDPDSTLAIRAASRRRPGVHSSRCPEILELAGGSPDHVVDLMSFHTDLREIDAVSEVARDFLSPDYPTWTPVGS